MGLVEVKISGKLHVYSHYKHINGTRKNQITICYITVFLFFLSLSSVFASFHNISSIFVKFRGMQPHPPPLPGVNKHVGFMLIVLFKQVIKEEKIQENAAQTGTYFILELRKMMDEFQTIGDVRGKGLMIGVELVKERVRTDLGKSTLLFL